MGLTNSSGSDGEASYEDPTADIINTDQSEKTAILPKAQSVESDALKFNMARIAALALLCIIAFCVMFASESLSALSAPVAKVSRMWSRFDRFELIRRSCLLSFSHISLIHGFFLALTTLYFRN